MSLRLSQNNEKVFLGCYLSFTNDDGLVKSPKFPPPCGGQGGGEIISLFDQLSSPPLNLLPPGEGNMTFYEFINDDLRPFLYATA